MKQYRIYLVGGVIDSPCKAAINNVIETEVMLRQLGQEVVSSARLITPGLNWRHALKQRLSLMLDCDAIYLLPNWEDNTEARLEYHNANLLEYTLIDNEIIEVLKAQAQQRNTLLNTQA